MCVDGVNVVGGGRVVDDCQAVCTCSDEEVVYSNMVIMDQVMCIVFRFK